MKKILFTDLDGTLLNNRSQIDEEMKQALREMTLKGHYLVLSSGRPLDSILEVKRLAGIDFPNVYIIGSNGAIIYNCDTKKNIHEIRVSYEDVINIWNFAKKHNVHVQTYTSDSIITATEDEEIAYYRQRIHLPLILNDAPWEILNQPPHKLLMIDLHDHTRIAGIQSQLESTYGDRLQTVFSNPYYLEVFAKDAGKGNSLRYLCDYLEIPLTDSYAAGDAENDLSMLQSAGTAIVMCNGTDELKKYADIITKRSNDECGLADIIYEYILTERKSTPT